MNTGNYLGPAVRWVFRDCYLWKAVTQVSAVSCGNTVRGLHVCFVCPDALVKRPGFPNKNV